MVNARDRILLAFRDLVLSEPFDELKSHDVIRRAGVARSTFYAHFHGKNDLLLSSLEPILGVLARACGDTVERSVLTATLEHVWENRGVGRVFFLAPVSARLAGELVRLLRRGRMDPQRSHFLAYGLLGLLGGWVTGQVSATPAELGEAVLAFSRRMNGPGGESAPAGESS